MRIATYNVEWFNSLFDDDGNPLVDEQWSGRHDVTRRAQLKAVGIVFKLLDADAIMVIEAPDHNKRRNTITALENFAELFGLRACKAMIGFSNHTQQEIALLYDPNVFSPTMTRCEAWTGSARRALIRHFSSTLTWMRHPNPSSFQNHR